ncbi:hypothetical protein JOC34_000628 [Virgibacillus halotolerans]|nr:hypothetical protein [Virgibacillus halotolerans]
MYKTKTFPYSINYQQWLEHIQCVTPIEIASVVKFDDGVLVTYKQLD